MELQILRCREPTASGSTGRTSAARVRRPACRSPSKRRNPEAPRPLHSQAPIDLAEIQRNRPDCPQSATRTSNYAAAAAWLASTIPPTTAIHAAQPVAVQ